MYCEGDVLLRCDTECEPLGEGLGELFFDCEAVVTEFDCKEHGDALGLDKTCVDFQRVSICADRERASCSADDPITRCTDSGAVSICTSFYDEGMFYETEPCDEGKTCHPQAGQCVDDPVQSCSEDDYPRCAGDDTVAGCQGQQQTFVSSFPCVGCQEDPESGEVTCQ